MTRSLEILEKLVAFDTVSARSNLDLIDYAQSLLETTGFEVTRLPDPDQPKAGLVATLGSGSGGAVLSAHVDVVPVEGQDWTVDPFRLTSQDGRLYGRGTTDMKGFAASMLACAERAAARDLIQPLTLVLSYDEEIGCLGIAQMRDRMAGLIGTPRYCIVGEPTQMHVAIGHKGKQALRAICQGEAGHSSLAPKFINALHLAVDFVQGLRRLQDDLARNGAHDDAYDIPYSTVHVGRLNGGTALNIVPDQAEVLFEFRHLAGDDPEMLRERIRDVALPTGQGRITIEALNNYPGLETQATADVVSQVQSLAQKNSTFKVPYGTEAGVFVGLGIPTVVCGPGNMEGQGHKPDEYLDASQLSACDAMMDRLLDSLM